MPGFGSGQFQDAFGEWRWSKQVLFDFLPEVYKNADKEQDGQPLETFIDGVRPAIDLVRARIRDFGDIRDVEKVRTIYNETSTLRLGHIKPNRGSIQQRGTDGKVQIVSNSFESLTARFRPEDIGKELIIVNATIPTNRNPCIITSITSPTVANTTPILSPEIGPLRWELRALSPDQSYTVVEVQTGDVQPVTTSSQIYDGYANFDVIRRDRFRTTDRAARLYTDRQGVGATVNSTGQIILPTSVLTQRDVGKHISLIGSSSSENNNSFEIRRVSGTSVSTSYQIVRGQAINGNVVYSAKLREFGAPRPRIKHVIQGTNTALSIEVSGVDIIVHLATDFLGVSTSTAAEVVTALNADVTIIPADPRSADFLVASLDSNGSGLAAASGFLTVEGYLLTQDSVLMNWAVLPRAELRLRGRVRPQGIITKDGFDLNITGSNTVAIVAGSLDSSDVGSTLLVRGSALGNDGVYTVLSVPTQLTMVVTPALMVAENPLYWELRTPTAFGDTAQVVSRMQPLAPILATDYGLEIDQYEIESRQRATLFNANQWLDKKGHPDSYSAIARTSGFDAVPVQLWRITADYIPIIPTGALYVVGDSCVNRSGTDGSITSDGVVIRFTSGTGVFDTCDEGQYIEISESGSPGNNKIFTIDVVLDAHTVDFRLQDTAGTTAPDSSLRWRFVKIYTTQAPLLPRYDEFNADALVEYILAKATTEFFIVDTFCWETDVVLLGPFPGIPNIFSTVMEIDVLSVTALSSSRFEVIVDTTAPLANIVEIIPDPGSFAGGPGFYGISFSKDVVTNIVTMTDPLANFNSTIIGQTIVIATATTPANNGPYLVLSNPSPSTITYYNLNGANGVSDPLAAYVTMSSVRPPVVRFTDFSGNVYFIETFPFKNAANQARFEVLSSIAPATGLGTFEFVCFPVIGECAFCPSSTFLIRLISDTIANDPPEAQFDVIQRTLTKFNRQIRPAHAIMIPQIELQMSAPLKFSALWTP